MMNLTPEAKASILVEALPYIQEYYGKVVVVKYGGNAMINEELKQAVISDIVLLNLVGIKVVLVHGGGPEISGLLKKMGKQSHFVKGLRYTDEETMDVVQMVLGGKVNKDLVSLFKNAGGKAVGLSGMDGGLFEAVKLVDPDGTEYGYVGEIVNTNPQIVLDMLEKGYIPVVSSVAVGVDEATSYNINADDAACAIAKALGAEKLAFLTDIAGVYKDPSDPSTLISTLTVDEAKDLCGSGFVGGGMLPKLNNCIDAVENGVSKVHILDGRIAHCILLEIFTKKGIGTAFLSEE